MVTIRGNAAVPVAAVLDDVPPHHGRSLAAAPVQRAIEIARALVVPVGLGVAEKAQGFHAGGIFMDQAGRDSRAGTTPQRHWRPAVVKPRRA